MADGSRTKSRRAALPGPASRHGPGRGTRAPADRLTRPLPFPAPAPRPGRPDGRACGFPLQGTGAEGRAETPCGDGPAGRPAGGCGAPYGGYGHHRGLVLGQRVAAGPAKTTVARTFRERGPSEGTLLSREAGLRSEPVVRQVGEKGDLERTDAGPAAGVYGGRAVGTLGEGGTMPGQRTCGQNPRGTGGVREGRYGVRKALRVGDIWSVTLGGRG